MCVCACACVCVCVCVALVSLGNSSSILNKALNKALHKARLLDKEQNVYRTLENLNDRQEERLMRGPNRQGEATVEEPEASPRSAKAKIGCCWWSWHGQFQPPLQF